MKTTMSTRPMRIYVAAAFGAANSARFLANELTSLGAEIVSTWHTIENASKPEPTVRTMRQEQLMKCLSEVDKADTVYFCSPQGSNPRCALVEVGYALAKDKMVIFWDDHCIADSHPNSIVEKTLGPANRYTMIEMVMDTETASVRPSNAETGGGVKYDGSKEHWSLMPIDGLRPVLKVLEHGAKKYSPDNWRKVVPFNERYGEALFRHVFELIEAFQDGRGIFATDEESNLPLLAHVACNALFLLAGPKK